MNEITFPEKLQARLYNGVSADRLSAPPPPKSSEISDEHEAYLARARDYSRIVRVGVRSDLPYIGRIIHTGETLGSVTDDINIAVQGARSILLEKVIPSHMKVAALNLLHQLTQAWEAWERNPVALSPAPQPVDKLLRKKP